MSSSSNESSSNPTAQSATSPHEAPPSSERRSEDHRPSIAEEARSLAASARIAALGTVDTHDGTPYASTTTCLGLNDGDVLLFMSKLAEHRQNIEADPRASLLVAEPERGAPPLSRPRLTLLGLVERDDRRDLYKTPWLEAHPDAERWIDFPDFAFFRLRVQRARLVSGFGRMGWLDTDKWTSADVDPISVSA